jgi:peptidoglycan LD-endopeptidase LytH
MKAPFIYLLFFVTLLAGCNDRFGGSGHRRAHEAYGQKLRAAGLDQTMLGQQWFSSAEQALAAAVPVRLPFAQQGVFTAELPRAVGLRFKVQQGASIRFHLEQRSVSRFSLFAEIFRVLPDGKPVFVAGADSTTRDFHFDAEYSGEYILRLQPELGCTGMYDLKIGVAPSLGFPVSGRQAKTGSFWGADRDGGQRRHEGIDIFAPAGTPVVAIQKGFVTRVEETKLGGKVVWMRPIGKNLHLYYAHLKVQLVEPGQEVAAGDMIGEVGNTGNARNTPPHLHFGIYTRGGAVDPFPFVDPKIKKAPSFKTDTTLFGSMVSLKGNGSMNVIGKLLDVSPDGITYRSPVGAIETMRPRVAQQIDNQGDMRKLLRNPHAFYLPDPKMHYALGDSAARHVRVFGYHEAFAWVGTGNKPEFWVYRKDLQ